MLCVPCVVALLKSAGLVMEAVPLVQLYEGGHCGRKKKKQKLMFPSKSSIVITAHRGDVFVCNGEAGLTSNTSASRRSTRHAGGSSADATFAEGAVISKQRPPTGTYVTESAAELLIRRQVLDKEFVHRNN